MLTQAEYRLPFDEDKYSLRISQGRNGPWSHKLFKREIPALPGQFSETDLSNAIDFALPLGTEVRAARSGYIYGVWQESDWCYEGLDPEIGNNPPFTSTNFIIINHGDSTSAVYSHLSRKYFVRRRQFVNAGDVIAFTGKSGWIAEIPHLHFQVNKVIEQIRSVPVAFINYKGELDHETLLRQGKIWFGE